MSFFTTNPRIVQDLFAKYSNTFVAFCELINNSLQAGAKEIKINITENPDGEIFSNPIKEIIIEDNGSGVSQSDFRKKILEIGTDTKTNGKGIGRFGSLQIGSAVCFETVSYDEINKKYTKSILPIEGLDLQNKNDISKIKLKDSYPELKGKQHETYFKVSIKDLYTKDDYDLDKKKKLSKYLLPENIAHAVFQQYPLEIINKDVKVFINKVLIDPESYIFGEPKEIKKEYIDKEQNKSPVTLHFIHFNSTNKERKVLLRVQNEKIKTIAAKFEYKCDLPDENGWFIYVDSPLFDEAELDINRNIILSDIHPEIKNLLESIRSYIDEFFQEKYKEYYEFKGKLKSDSFYPYIKFSPSSESKRNVFNQIAYHLEKEYNLLRNNVTIRKVIYPLVDRAINNGNIESIVNSILDLKDEKLEKFKDLLKKVNLDEVIEFSEKIARRNQFLDFLYKIIYEEPSKFLKERSQLHKIIEKELWLFGEQYESTTKLFSDKNLEKNLEELSKKHLSDQPTVEDENLIEVRDEKLRTITDLFFFNEKRIGENESEIMVVELKSPICKITQKEIGQIDKYAFQIGTKGNFPKVKYKLILISSDLNEFAQSQIGIVEESQPFLYKINKEKNISIYLYKWSDLIHSLRKKLSYMSNSLKVKDRELKKVFDEDYKDIDFMNITSFLQKEKE